MKIEIPTRLTTALSLVVVAAFSLALAKAATSNAPAVKAASPDKSQTNSPAMEIPIPQSVFEIPKSRSEGTDPFFPDTTRFKAAASAPVALTNKAPARPALVINGFSSIPTPSVIINGATFAAGEEREVTSPQGRTKVRCLEIRIQEEMAVVEWNGERRELYFRRGK